MSYGDSLDISLAAYLEAVLVQQGSPRYIFGVPGAGHDGGFLQAVSDAGHLQPVMCMQARTAAYAAYGYARSSGALGLCFLGDPAVAAYAAAGLEASQQDGVSLACITAGPGNVSASAAAPGSQVGRDASHVLSAVTGASIALRDGDRAPSAIAEAIRVARCGPRGAVHLSLDDAQGSAARIPSSQRAPQEVPDHRPFDPTAIERAAELIGSRDRVVLLAGHGVARSGASAALQAFAERHAIPVATTPKGRVFSERHPLSLGVYGKAGHLTAERFVEQADLVLVIGSSLGPHVLPSGPLEPGKLCVQMDIDPAALGLHTPIDCGVVADARAGLDALSAALEEHPASRSQEEVAQEIVRIPRCEPLPHVATDGGPMHPGALVEMLDKELPPETVLVVDNGPAACHAAYRWRAEPGAYIQASGVAEPGAALSIATGVRMARPDQVVLSLVSDQAFAVNADALQLQSEYGVKVINLVFNDSGHGMGQQFQRTSFGRGTSPSRFVRPVDAARVAEGYHVRGFSAPDIPSFRRAMREALAHHGPSVVDLRVDPTVAKPLRSPFLPRLDHSASKAAPPATERKPFADDFTLDDVGATQTVSGWNAPNPGNPGNQGR